ncbi:cyclophilin-like fold protein [Mangrovibacter sp. MFB070]|uniref:cyclophilin-like fold protein n=1 Tax=Mangrovibacter sp. MFB070 TaxID=1224318 RepID=UPI000AD131E4|nr:cyclophilin-like fold protein [Mangrovibacter sp. MFB070]
MRLLTTMAISHLLLSWLFIALPASASTALQGDTMKLHIITNNQLITATLNTTPAAQAFAKLLPLTLTLKDYAGEEKISDLPVRLPTDGSPAGTAAHKGDIMVYAPWGNLALFYKNHGYAAGLVKLGQLDNPDELPAKPASYTARFELAGE